MAEHRFPISLHKFHAFSIPIRRSKGITFLGRVLALDPGETTGFAVFDYRESYVDLYAGQVKTWPIENAVHQVGLLLEEYRPNFLVYESYHVYSWKADQHKNSEIATVQIIGCIQTLAILNAIPIHRQTAQEGKTFCTDSKLESWGMWLEGLKHARDACRHGAYWLLFG